MRFSFWSGEQSWNTLLGIARHAEATGWDRVYFADHFMPNGPDTSAPWNEAWTTIAALAALVPRVGIGPLVTGNVQEITETVKAYADAGVDELVVPDFNLGPMEAKLPILDRFITEVAPAFRAPD